MLSLDVRTILLLRDSSAQRVLLLRRSPDKRLFPGLITGIGGKVELAAGEGEHLEAAALRELEEETGIAAGQISNLRLRLSTLQTRQDQPILLLWFTATIETEALPACTEGTLAWYPVSDLPLQEMIPTARLAIPFVLRLSDSDAEVYSGVFDPAAAQLQLAGKQLVHSQ